MTFNDLAEKHGRRVNDPSDTYDNRQRINLSNYADSVILNDADIFFILETKMPGKDPENRYSKYINTVIRNFSDSSIASAAQLRKQETARLEEILKGIPKQEESKQRLLKNFEQGLEERRASFLKKKGSSHLIRLSRESVEYLVSKDGQDNAIYYSDKISHFLKVLVEDFTSKSYSYRERVFFKSLVETTQAAIKDQSLIKVKLHNYQRTENALERKTFYLKPYAILTDTGGLYNYIVGFRSMDMKEPWSPYSVRLSSIFECKKLSASRKISKEERQGLESQIEELGVQYVGPEKPEKIIVELTEEGEKLYRRILHQRPLYDRKEDKNLPHRTHCFLCSPFQARVYFSRFGKDAKVLEPKYLAEELKSLFEEAAARYEE